MKIRDRIKDFRRVRASELVPHPKNWRTHPQAQREALSGLLSEIGYVDAVIVRESDDGQLVLIDGHLRAETTPDAEIPVLVLDVDEAEANLVLATLDPLAGLAEADAEQLESLLADVRVNDVAVQELLEGLSAGNGMYDADESDMPDVASGDREPFQQMMFTLHDDQAERVKAAIEKAKKAGPFAEDLNENSNGNALTRIAEAYLGPG